MKAQYLKDPSSGAHAAQMQWSLGANEQGDNAAYIAKMATVQVYGEFGGAECVIEGRNAKGSDSVKLSHQFDEDLSFRAPGFRSIRDIPMLIAPRIIGGDKETRITVIIYMVP